ncbi:glucan 1,4-alpha-glucosidase [Kibdelosporangium aridum]|uniref:Glucan 1,4-alpha-glucosidase n=2 Tax=Kibdelosporangium aridum TaxID=2030 RepID=A0A428ZEJ8_KIBAR|nr:glucan 1,4-alpha-glucosidase [Kibdelosporangium aridum]
MVAPPALGQTGANPGYLPADKQGFGTARSIESPVWFTLGRGGMTETFYPDLSTPASRRLDFVVTDGRAFVQRLSDVRVRTEQDRLSYRQIANGRGWTATVTYVTDPARASVMIDFELRSHRPLRGHVLYEPTLSAKGVDDQGKSVGDALVASDGTAASALVAEPPFFATSTGNLRNLQQTGQLKIDGVRDRNAVVILSYGDNEQNALTTARASAQQRFADVRRSYVEGWNDYLRGLKTPASAQRAIYETSVLVLAASEDKRNRGAFIASPSEPWAFGTNQEVSPTPGPYHLVWPRDLYQIATALIAAGDVAAANRTVDHIIGVQQPDGHFPQNNTVSGRPYWTSIQLDESALPIVLAWQLDRRDTKTVAMVRRAADFIIGYEQDGFSAPWSQQERWENQSGYSPGTIAATIAGLVCAADMVERSGDAATAQRYRSIADDWAARVESWTVTSNGPHSPQPYYLRLTKDGQPNQGTAYNPGDNYPGTVDQRTQVDPSFLELVRLGVKSPQDATIRNTIDVVDRVLGETTPVGQFWHRFTNDGFGERPDGGPWDIGKGRTYGRLWPIFAGERGEYELLAGKAHAAKVRLRAMAATANDSMMLPEQVWDREAPFGRRPGTPTTSATPLVWTHAQYVRLAWSIDAGKPVEQPGVVAERYLK